MTTDVRVRLACAAMVVATMVVAACGGSSGENPMAPSPPTDPGNTTATFSSISSQIFAQRCTACHSGSAAEAGLNLSSATAYNALVNVPSSQRGGSIRVVPGNADGSYLVQKLLGDAGIVGQRMPAGGPFLSTDQINLIRQWISAGAQNN